MSPKQASLVLLSLSGALGPLLALAQPAAPPLGPPSGPPPPMPTMAETRYYAALEIRDGKLVKGLRSARLDDTHASGFALASSRAGYNGIIISGGHSAVTLKDTRISLKGVGRNDFLAIGAGVLVRDSAATVIDHATIETAGAVASALAVAEGATLRVYDSRLAALGGPLPKGYVRHIGPGMMEPPAPLGLEGTARTVLAMSNARAYFYRTTIEADGWGALSTDAAGDRLYVEANDCILRVKRAGYATYADFGAHVVLNRTKVESGAEAGIIAGEARIDFNRVTGKAGRNGVMIHSVMGNPQEVATLNLIDTTLAAAGPVLLVKSANAAITISGGQLTSAGGVLLAVRRNDDANATKTLGTRVPGVTLTLRATSQQGEIANSDDDRNVTVVMDHARLTGALHNVTLKGDSASRWTATGPSQITLDDAATLAVINAPTGVSIKATTRDPAIPAGTRILPSGGELTVTPS